MPIQIGDVELARVHRITTLEEAAFVHHSVPGAEGNVLQNLGRRSVRLRVEGIFYGATAAADLAKLRAVYTAREPVDFIADVVGDTYVSKVAVDRLEVAEVAGEPDQFSFAVILAEFVEPPASGAAAVEAVNAAVAVDAAALMELATLPDALALGSLPEISNPFAPLKDALNPLADASAGVQQSMAGLKILLEV
ncbi:MAG TPA: DNA circularization N-terminal domain-containing protein [Longimicrobium sp.]|nr:DNA circularization N-terminal domain-containing protein [Longimicrobium sp.]